MLRASNAARFGLAGAALLAGLAITGRASAEVGVAIHAEGAVAHMVGNTRSDQFGFGGAGLLGVEVALHPVLGVDLPLGMVGLRAAAEQPASLAHVTSATGFYATPGIRVRPLAVLESRWARSLWIAAGGGVSFTGGQAFPALSLRAGLDAPLGRLAVGPYAGLVQMIDRGQLAMDARVVSAGLHGTLDVVPLRRRAPVGIAALPPEPDRDGEPTSIDVCPDPCVDTSAPPPVAAPRRPALASPGPLVDHVRFATGEATITPDGAALLVRVALYLRAHPEHAVVQIAGHADETGDDTFNDRLSERRAHAVAASLAALGVEPARLRLVYFGASRPRRAGLTPEARRDNRRVELTVIEEAAR
jgi:outer membrane protein OmpA-like peptidoglycan-associated protein